MSVVPLRVWGKIIFKFWLEDLYKERFLWEKFIVKTSSLLDASYENKSIETSFTNDTKHYQWYILR